MKKILDAAINQFGLKLLDLQLMQQESLKGLEGNSWTEEKEEII